MRLRLRCCQLGSWETAPSGVLKLDPPCSMCKTAVAVNYVLLLYIFVLFILNSLKSPNSYSYSPKLYLLSPGRDIRGFDIQNIIDSGGAVRSISRVGGTRKEGRTRARLCGGGSRKFCSPLFSNYSLLRIQLQICSRVGSDLQDCIKNLRARCVWYKSRFEPNAN